MNIVLVLIIPAAELLFVEESNLKYQLFTVNANKVRVSYSYRATVSLDAEIKADSWKTGLDVMEIWTIHIQECCEGTWHELVEDGDHCISNAHILLVVEGMVHGIYIDDVRTADWCIDWQLGIDAQVFDLDLFIVVLHNC